MIFDIDAIDNEYASKDGNDIHIIAAASGRRGYRCLGCEREMDAVLYKDPNHRSFFRHVVRPGTNNAPPCNFTTKVYLERLAKKVLQENKRIRVPAVIKFPPIGLGKQPIPLQEEKFIEAHTVSNAELSFYEDAEGMVKYGSNPEIKERNFLIRPDVVFFDSKDSPFLFIELVVTNNISPEKLARLQRIGIDTVQVKIPRDPEKIKTVFETAENTHWVYNYEEFNTDYLSLSQGDGTRILTSFENQGPLPEESAPCRGARIRNLIHSANSYLGSEPCKAIIRNLKSEIARIDKELGPLEERRRRDIEEKFGEEIRRLEQLEREVEAERRRVTDLYRELEGRYTYEKNRIDAVEKAVKEDTRKLTGFSDPERELPARTKSISGDIERERRKGKEKEKEVQEHRTGTIQTGGQFRTMGSLGKYRQDYRNLQDEESALDYQLGEFNRIKGRIEQAATGNSGRGN